MSSGLVKANVNVLPAPQPGPGADAQKLVLSSPMIEVGGYPLPVELAVTFAIVTGVPRSGSIQ
jgi:hypothetical protein